MTRAILAAAALLGSVASAHAVPSTSVAVSGLVAMPMTFTQAGLAALPQVTRTESFTSGGRATSDSFTGPTLSAVLAAAGGIVTNPANKNDLLQTFVVATGTDGYTAVVSAGEIAANFGAKPDLVAIADTAGSLPGTAGVARLTATGDVAGGRYVSNLASLTVAHGPVVPGTGGGPSSSVSVQGAVNMPLTFTQASLSALPAYTETVSYRSPAGTTVDTYTGALLWDVLSSAGIALNPATKNDVLRRGVVATGTDGYSVDFALGELSPAFGNEPVLVAYADTAGQLGSFGNAGFARIVVPGDGAGGRYVSNLVALTVFDATAVPEPGSVALLSAGLLGLFARQRSAAARKAAMASR